MPLSEQDAAFLAERNLTFLFARHQDGSPAGWPMTSVLTDDGLTFSTYAKSAKVQACLAAGHATALVVRRDGDEFVRAVCVSGPASLLRPGGQDAVPHAAAGPGGSAAAGSAGVPGHIRDRVRAAAAEGKRALLTLDVSAGASWSTGEADSAQA